MRAARRLRLSGPLAPDVLPILVIVGVHVLYQPVMTTLYGGTLGKIACGLRVVRLSDGEHLSYWQAFRRYAVEIPFRVVWPLGLVDVLMCTWDRPYYQCIHDKLVRSVVVVRIPR
ncbi:MAG: hypothetical protein HOY71_31920 [Nonomuraea sp.]|nr:hypothetical protein [Nonomuraea sp.]